jgi:glutathione synthase/RimK-type ligase-like ATP-grasp enzyme
MIKRYTTTQLLFSAAGSMGLDPQWVVKNGLFAITINNTEHYINFERSPINSHLSISLSGNKYLTRLILKRHGLLNIPFKRARTQESALEFLLKYEKIIAKPVRGSGSRDIHIITNANELKELNISAYILEKYQPGIEMRYLVLGDKVVAVHRSSYGVSVEETRELERISYAENEWDQVIAAQSLHIAKLLGLEFAAVDYIVDENGTYHVLEVGAAPGFKWFDTPSSGPKVDIAKMFLDSYIAKSTPLEAKV